MYTKQAITVQRLRSKKAKRKNKIKRQSKNSNQNGKEARLSEVKEDNWERRKGLVVYI